MDTQLTVKKSKWIVPRIVAAVVVAVEAVDSVAAVVAEDSVVAVEEVVMEETEMVAMEVAVGVEAMVEAVEEVAMEAVDVVEVDVVEVVMVVEESGMEDMEAINSSFRINEECDFYKAMLINVADINDQYGQMIFYLEPFSRFQ